MAIGPLETPHLLVLAGLALMIAEAMIPGGHFVVLGVALLLAGLLGTLVDPLAAPIALAGLTLLFGAVALYVYREFDFYGSGSAGQTSDSSSLRGQTGRVVERVTETDGRIKLDDGGFNPFYQGRAFDDDIDVGEEVTVVDPGGGNVLTVASLAAAREDDIDRELRRDAERSAADEGADADGSAGSGATGGTEGGDDTDGAVTTEGGDDTGGAGAGARRPDSDDRPDGGRSEESEGREQDREPERST